MRNQPQMTRINMPSRVRKPIFEASMSDEVELARQAMEMLGTLSSPPSKEEILSLQKTHSIEVATRCFYEGIKQSTHRTIIDKINTQETDVSNRSSGIKLYILPGMFYKSHPEVGTDGALIADVGKKFGFDIELIGLKSTGSISTNADILKKRLKDESHNNVWIVSISKGGCDVRRFLQSNKKPSCLTGWISIAGVHKGVPFIDSKFTTLFHRMLNRTLCYFLRIDYQALQELRTSDEGWNNKSWPLDLEIINVVPVPIITHVQKAIIHRYKQTLTLGPNDGFIPLVDVLDLPGHIFPIWGCDHFFRTPELSAYIYKLFNYIATTKNSYGRSIE